MFTTKAVLSLLADNYKTFRSLQAGGGSSEPTGAAAAVATDAAPDMPAIKELVEAVLTETDMSGRRAAKLDLDDFLLYVRTQA